MKKVVYIVSDINKALAFEWLAKSLKDRVDLIFILIGKSRSTMAEFLLQERIKFYEIDRQKENSRLKRWRALFTILKTEAPEVVHTHLWEANILGLSAAWILRVPRRIYTRHHATVHYYEHPQGRKWDRICNAMATDIVAISKNIKNILVNWDKANPAKITLIPHGFDFSYFGNVANERVANLKRKYELNDSGPVVGVIARYMNWKGIQYIVPAFAKLLASHPNAKLVLANAQGEFQKEVKDMLRALPPSSFREIAFEEDLAALYRLFDVYIHVPVDENVEAFGQTYVEALITGIPSVFTRSGIAAEFIKHNENALLVDFCNSDQIVDSANLLLKDVELRDRIVAGGTQSIQQFSLDKHIFALLKLYRV